MVAYHLAVLDKVVTEVLEFAKDHQTSRVADQVTNVTNFTEGWFRNSGIYRLGGIDTDVLDFAMNHQAGRVSDGDTNVSFNFTVARAGGMCPNKKLPVRLDARFFQKFSN
jgi:hypothetical protein